MEKKFTIKFDFPLDRSSIVIKLEATAMLHHSIPYYPVSNFQYTNHQVENEVSLLPEQEILMKTKNGQKTWVHKDSERETQLSNAIGKAIEEALTQKDNRPRLRLRLSKKKPVPKGTGYLFFRVN